MRQSCQLVYDCLQDNVCTPFKGYFTKIEHNINTRNNGCSLKLPKAKLEFGRRSFAFQGALVYNTLPRHLRNLNSRFLFKSNLKEFFSVVLVLFYFIFSSSICKLPIRSEIYNCTSKNTNKVSIIIIITSTNVVVIIIMWLYVSRPLVLPLLFFL